MDFIIILNGIRSHANVTHYHPKWNLLYISLLELTITLNGNCRHPDWNSLHPIVTTSDYHPKWNLMFS